jgi:NET1-associated nuclear protein 1 (U3 small nucleolar RNA-associated protein 17)
MVWDFLDGVLLQTVDVGQSIHHICAHEKFEGFVFVAASKRANKTLANGVYSPS